MAREHAVRSRTAYKWVLFLVLLILAMPALIWLARDTGVFGGAGRDVPAAPRAIRESDLDAAFLLRLQDRLVAAQMARARAALRANGYSDDLPPPRVSSTYVTSNGHRFGLVRSRIAKEAANVEAVLIVGIVDGKLRHVLCTSTGGEVPLDTGPCAQKIGEAFGVAL
jgi:hypothetical protein